MVKETLNSLEHPKKLTHLQTEKKRKKRKLEKDKNRSQKEESNQANRQTHK